MHTLAQYRNMLRSNKLRLDDELEIQAELQDRIGQEFNRMTARAASAKDELARTEARLTEDAYKDAIDRGVKVTVDSVASGVKRHPQRIAAWEKWQNAENEAREWDTLLEAWKVKGFNLRDLAALFGSDYFAMRTVTVDSGVDRSAVDRAIAEGRDRMNEAREGATPPERKRVARR